MKKSLFLSLLLLLGSQLAFADAPTIGVLDFKAAISQSKAGQQEINTLETLKKQMSSQLEKSEKELEELAKKLEDSEYLDTLSPAAEDELKQKFTQLSQDFTRYQNQYYQLLNQASYRSQQVMHTSLSQASAIVAQQKKLALVIGDEMLFYYAPTLNITPEVVVELDKAFAAKAAEAAKPANAS